MTEKYDQTYAVRPYFADFPPMCTHDRAAQFSPFAALVGYGDAVEETARLTDRRLELPELESEMLNADLNRLLDMLSVGQPEVTVTYFIPDGRKQGGRYADKTGTVRIYDSYENSLVFTDAARISVSDIYSLSFIEDKQ